ncbi:MAG: phosphate ABC transporter permease subunit PstC [Pseudomonadota bacterium]
MLTITALIILAISLAGFVLSRRRAAALAGERPSELHSRPSYHGLYTALTVGLVGIAILLVATTISRPLVDTQLRAALPESVASYNSLRTDRLIEDAKALGRGEIVMRASDDTYAAARAELAEIYGGLNAWREWSIAIASILASVLVFLFIYSRITLTSRARNASERIIRGVLFVSAGIAILTTIGILFSLIGETTRFFSDIPLWKFLFGTHWSPLSGVFGGKINEDTVGAIPLFAGTFMITIIAMLVAVPIGLMASIYLSDYASARTRSIAKPLLEILAGIPTVVYGFFAAITVAPLIRRAGESIGLSVASESALAAGVVMGIMIIPFISSLSDDVINAVPQSLRDGSYGLGATKAETITKVVLPAALPGIVSAVLLGISRAVGETMIVVMAAGQGANLTWNPLEAVTTVTVQIVALITGDTEADTAAGPAFALGFTLLVLTLLLNMFALRIVQKYRLQYE